MNEIWFLNGVNLFEILCPHKLSTYKNEHGFLVYKKDEYVYFENEQSNKMFLINKGKIKIGYYNDDGTEFIKAILTKGDVFGEKCLLGETKRTEFAKALNGEISVCPLQLDTALGLLKNDNDFSLKIYKIIGFKIKRLERQLKILLFKDIKTRLIEFIKDLIVEFGIKNNQSQTIIKHPYCQTDIAALIGTSRPTINIFFNELKNDNIISFTRKEIIVHKIDFFNL